MIRLPPRSPLFPYTTLSRSLSDEEVDALETHIERQGIDFSDDCGRSGVEPTSFRNGELAAATTDALQLFLNEIRRYPLRSEEHTSELQSRQYLVCRLLLEKK